MTPIDYRITEVIPRADVNSFLAGITTTLANMSPDGIEQVYLYSLERNAIVISFDGTWRPFFGYTRGYNYPEDRTYMIGGGAFLALVRSRFKSLPHDIPGGRVFLSSDRAFRVLRDYKEETFLRYIWLSDSGNVFFDVLWLLLQSLKSG